MGNSVKNRSCITCLLNGFEQRSTKICKLLGKTLPISFLLVFWLLRSGLAPRFILPHSCYPMRYQSDVKYSRISLVFTKLLRIVTIVISLVNISDGRGFLLCFWAATLVFALTGMSNYQRLWRISEDGSNMCFCLQTDLPIVSGGPPKLFKTELYAEKGRLVCG